MPADIWSGLDTISDFSPTAYRWCYAQSPRVEDLPSGNHTVQVTLITVPPEGASLNGFSGIILHSFVPGAVLVSNGITTTIAVSFAPGLGDAPVNASGATLSITATIADNGATGGAAVVGANLAITCSLSYAPPATVDVDRFELLGLIEDDLQNLGF